MAVFMNNINLSPSLNAQERGKLSTILMRDNYCANIEGEETSFHKINGKFLRKNDIFIINISTLAAVNRVFNSTVLVHRDEHTFFL